MLQNQRSFCQKLAKLSWLHMQSVNQFNPSRVQLMANLQMIFMPFFPFKWYLLSKFIDQIVTYNNPIGIEYNTYPISAPLSEVFFSCNVIHRWKLALLLLESLQLINYINSSKYWTSTFHQYHLQSFECLFIIHHTRWKKPKTKLRDRIGKYFPWSLFCESLCFCIFVHGLHYASTAEYRYEKNISLANASFGL